jgi:hypothetical protein
VQQQSDTGRCICCTKQGSLLGGVKAVRDGLKQRRCVELALRWCLNHDLVLVLFARAAAVLLLCANFAMACLASWRILIHLVQFIDNLRSILNRSQGTLNAEAASSMVWGQRSPNCCHGRCTHAFEGNRPANNCSGMPVMLACLQPDYPRLGSILALPQADTALKNKPNRTDLPF